MKKSRESKGVYKLLPWTIAITMSLILMLYINDQNSTKFEKFGSFYEGFLTSCKGLTDEQVQNMNSIDDYWLNAIFEKVNKETEDPYEKMYNTILSKEVFEGAEEFYSAISNNVISYNLAPNYKYIKFDTFQKKL